MWPAVRGDAGGCVAIDKRVQRNTPGRLMRSLQLQEQPSSKTRPWFLAYSSLVAQGGEDRHRNAKRMKSRGDRRATAGSPVCHIGHGSSDPQAGTHQQARADEACSELGELAQDVHGKPPIRPALRPSTPTTGRGFLPWDQARRRAALRCRHHWPEGSSRVNCLGWFRQKSSWGPSCQHGRWRRPQQRWCAQGPRSWRFLPCSETLPCWTCRMTARPRPASC